MGNKIFIVFQIGTWWMGIAGSAQGTCRITLPEKSFQDALRSVNPKNAFSEYSGDFFNNLITDLKKYFSRLPVDFSVNIDFSEVTLFQKSVYQTAMTIPYGETRSYGWIADKIGNPRAARAVGQALHRNPLPILVPCHRVLPSSGGLGGFAGGITLKRYLLKLESVTT